jgi:hypothetical protein
MTNQEFNDRCAALLGRRGWKIAFSRATGLGYSTVKKWSAGDLPVPEYAASIVELLEGVPPFLRPHRWRR